MNRRHRLRRIAWLLAALAAALPLLAMIPFGALWLWQQGWLLPWLAIAAGLAVITWGSVHLAGREPHRANEPDHGPLSGPDPEFSPLDLAAWSSVQDLAAEVEANVVLDRRRLLDTARLTIETVARHYHPDVRHPLWHFTLPEFLLLSERVSARLRRVLLEQVPGAHMIRAGDILRAWELKPLAARGMKVAKTMNLAWRIGRWLNPASALLGEARERLVGAAFGDAGEWVKQRGSRLWVEEVGRAAIELYSGRLGSDAEHLAEQDASAPAGVRAGSLPGRLRILVGGQTNAGKSSLIDVLLDTRAAGVDALPLTRAETAYTLHRDGELEATLVDTPGLDGESTITRLVELAWESDLLVWVVAGHRADRGLDRKALDAIRARFAAEPRRSMPPLRVVVTHLDRLSPAREWQPPYDLNHPDSDKAKHMHAALEAVARDLGVALETVLPVRLQPPAARYNIELLWPAITEDLDAAHRARVLRLTLAGDGERWRMLLAQARAAGRALRGAAGG